MEHQDNIESFITNFIVIKPKTIKYNSTEEEYWNNRPYFWENYFKEYYEAHGMKNVKIDYIRPSFVGKSKCLDTMPEE